MNKNWHLNGNWFDEFFAEGLISDVLAQLKSGKEATVFVCRPGPAPDVAGAELLAVKCYRDRLGRGFQNRAAYMHGRYIGDARAARAVANKSRFGHHAAESMWVTQEFEMLCRLHAAGADVPQPFAASEASILMEFVGDESGPAPQLREFRPTTMEAHDLLGRMIWNIERFLASNVIHGDLSPYNALVRNARPVIIDLPQAVDSRTNANARELLFRDVDRVCRHFERFGATANAEKISSDLWQRFLRAELRGDPAVA